MPPDFANGKICYIEMPALNIDTSAAFYKTVFDWDVRKRGDDSTAFDDGVGQVSGTWDTGRRAEADPGILIHIMVEDIVATAKAVIDNGGEIVQPADMNAENIYATFRDPAGNVMGIFQEPSLAVGKD